MTATGKAPDSQARVRQSALAAAGATVVQVGGNLYVSEEGLSALWESAETVPGQCPYPGLDAFGPAQAKWFFGREKLTGDLITELDKALRAGHGGPVTVIGPSGAGKSSLLGAGLLGALQVGRLPVAGADSWPMLTLTPGATPLHTLAETLHTCGAALSGQRAEPAPEMSWGAALAELKGALRSAGSGQRVVVVADQFEELFTASCAEAERVEFLDALSAIAAPGPDGPAGLVVLGMRADFYSQATEYPVLRAALQNAQLVIGAMSQPEVTEAITRPARAVGLRLDGGLAERLLRDLGGGVDGAGYEAGRLPLLAYALRATWQRRSGTRLAIAGYEQTGGIAGAIAKAAEDVYEGLNDEGRRVARQIFLSLVRVGTGEVGEGTPDIRRRVTKAHLYASTSDPAAAEEVLDAFTTARLVTSGGQTVEITHDALLSRWPRLKEWISDDRKGNLTRQSLEEAATAWDSEGRDTAALYGGSRLAAAQEWADDPGRPRDLSRVARDFLAASGRMRRRAVRRRNAVIAILAALSLGLAGLSGYAFYERAQAQTALTLEGGSVFAGDASQALGRSDPGSAMEFAVQAERMNPASVQTRNTLLGMESEAFIGRLTGDDRSVEGVAYSPSGDIIATGSRDGTLRLWDATTHAQVARLVPDGGKAVGKVVFSPGGGLLATGEPYGVLLWNVADRRHPVSLDRFPTGSTGADSIAFSPNGQLLVAGNGNGQVAVWALPSGHLLTVLRAAPPGASTLYGVSRELVDGVAFTPDGVSLITATDGGTIRVWDVPQMRLVGTLPVDDFGGAVAVSPRGLVAVTNLINGVVHGQLWNLATRTLDTSLPFRLNQTGALAFSPDGSLLATGDVTGLVRLWDVSGTTPTLQLNLAGDTDQVNALAFSSDGKTLASADTDGTVALWSVLGNTIDGYNDPAVALAFSPDGTMLAVGSVPGGASGVTLYSVSSRRKIASLRGPLPGKGTITAVSFSPDGKTLAVAFDDPANTVQLWDVAGRTILGDIYTHQIGEIRAIAFSPHGRVLATSGVLDPVVKLWDPATMSPAGTLPGNSGYEGFPSSIPGVWSLAFSPDGKLLAAAGSDGVVRVGNLAGRVVSATLARTSTGQSNAVVASSAAFSPDGSLLAVGYSDGTIDVWKPQCGCAPQFLHSDDQSIWSVAFSPDGHTLFSSSEDDYVRFWPVGSWGSPVSLQASGGTLGTMTVSPVGSMIATEDGSAVRLWDTDPVQVAEQICRTLGAPLPQSAWQQYSLSEFAYTPICPAR